MAEQNGNGKAAELPDSADDGEPAPAFLTAARDADYSTRRRSPVPAIPKLRNATGVALTSVSARARDIAIRDRALADLQEAMAQRETNERQQGNEAMHETPPSTRQDPLQNIAHEIGALTYGDMMEMAEGIVEVEGYKPPTTPEEYAAQLHAWTRRQTTVEGKLAAAVTAISVRR